jgi:hypothetical protein
MGKMVGKTQKKYASFHRRKVFVLGDIHSDSHLSDLLADFSTDTFDDFLCRRDRMVSWTMAVFLQAMPRRTVPFQSSHGHRNRSDAMRMPPWERRN